MCVLGALSNCVYGLLLVPLGAQVHPVDNLCIISALVTIELLATKLLLSSNKEIFLIAHLGLFYHFHLHHVNIGGDCACMSQIKCLSRLNNYLTCSALLKYKHFFF